MSFLPDRHLPQKSTERQVFRFTDFCRFGWDLDLLVTLSAPQISETRTKDVFCESPESKTRLRFIFSEPTGSLGCDLFCNLLGVTEFSNARKSKESQKSVVYFIFGMGRVLVVCLSSRAHKVKLKTQGWSHRSPSFRIGSALIEFIE